MIKVLTTGKTTLYNGQSVCQKCSRISVSVGTSLVFMEICFVIIIKWTLLSERRLWLYWIELEVKLFSDWAKANAKAKVFFDVCHLFSDLFGFRLSFCWCEWALAGQLIGRAQEALLSKKLVMFSLHSIVQANHSPDWTIQITLAKKNLCISHVLFHVPTRAEDCR